MDKIEVKISPIAGIKFPEAIKVFAKDSIPKKFLKESFTNSNTYIDVLGVSDDNLLFSNCTSLAFAIKTRENSPLFESSPSKLTYEELLQSIDFDMSNRFYKENIERLQLPHNKHSDYLPHILDEDITDEQLSILFAYYRNFGVCHRSFLQIKNNTGDQTIYVDFF